MQFIMNHQNRFILGILLCLGLSSNTGFSGGDVVNNGGGYAEQTVQYLYVNLKVFIGSCLDLGHCDISPTDREVLNQVRAQHPFPGAKVFRYQAAAAVPGYFTEGSSQLAYRLEPLQETPIVLNRDFLYFKEDDGQERPISPPQALSLVVASLSQWVANIPYSQALSLGQAVSAGFQQLSEQLIVGHRKVLLPHEQWIHFYFWSLPDTSHPSGVVTELMVQDRIKNHRLICETPSIAQCRIVADGSSHLPELYLFNVTVADESMTSGNLSVELQGYAISKSNRFFHWRAYFGFTGLELKADPGSNSVRFVEQ